jgi:hypothetical protein
LRLYLQTKNRNQFDPFLLVNIFSGKHWRPRRDLNPCRRRERPGSWARLDDGDVLVSHAGFEPATLCLKVLAGGRLEPTLIKLHRFFKASRLKWQLPTNLFGGNSRIEGGQRKAEDNCGYFSKSLNLRASKPSIPRIGLDTLNKVSSNSSTFDSYNSVGSPPVRSNSLVILVLSRSFAPTALSHRYSSRSEYRSELFTVFWNSFGGAVVSSIAPPIRFGRLFCNAKTIVSLKWMNAITVWLVFSLD